MEKLSEKTWVPIGAVLALASVISGAAWWASSMYSRLGYAETNIASQKNVQDAMLRELRTMNETLIEIKSRMRK